MNRSAKVCIVCGREIQWRRKWQNNWHQIEYCSRACRKSGLTKIDIDLEKAILRLLRSRKTGASICPSEAVRELVHFDDQSQWQSLMEPARRAARRLVHLGKIQIMQGASVVNPSKFKGPIRLRLKH